MSAERKIKIKVRGSRTTDGAGVSLVRVLGLQTVKEFDPVLMLDSFDSTDPDEYTAGFPMHPHRGIETISFVNRGYMKHSDSLGFEDTVGDGEVQWMTAGSGILHEEQIPASERLLGVQLWLNLPSKEKMTAPKYHAVKKEDIPEIQIGGGKIRLLAGKYEAKDGQIYEGYKPEHLPFDYYDIHLDKGAGVTIPAKKGRTVILFTLSGDAVIGGERVEEKTAVRLSDGDEVRVSAGEHDIKLLFISSQPLGEPVAWGGPVVMNTREELETAFAEMRTGNFIKHRMETDE